MARTPGVIATIVILAATSARAQLPAFEVASIKVNASGSQRSNFEVTPGRLTATNVSVLQMISMAYTAGGPLPAGSIIDAPEWTRTMHFDIAAKAEGQPTPDQVRTMIRALLAERFHLRLRPESRQRPVYRLTVARASRSPGAQMHRVDTRCTGDPVSADAALRQSVSGDTTGDACQLRIFPGKLTGRAITMEQLAKALVGAVDDHREIRNQTGLEGRFDVDLEWRADAAIPLSGRDLDAPPLPPIDPNAPGLFTAVQDQLGLKLEPLVDSAEVFVVEQVDRPTVD